jgi:phospholipid/cholesterol/gamma-HCH transport system substrate-binding protein
MSAWSHGVPSRWVPLLLAGALAVSGCAIQPNDHTLPGQVAVGDDGYTVTVHFDQIENLVPNSTVQSDNVVIGTVASIDTEDWKAVVKLRLLRDIPLPKDAVFSIGQKTLLGAQYVDVKAAGTKTEAGDAVLQDGDVVPIDQTGAYPATEQVLGAVALLLNNGGLSQISTITGELSTALHGKVPDTRGLIRRANDLLKVLDRNRGEIVAALESLDTLSAGLAGDRTRLVEAIDRIAPGLRVLEEERHRLVAAVAAASRTSQRAVGVIHGSEEALLANLDALGPIFRNLGRVSESLPEALKMGLSIPFPAMTTPRAIKGDYLNLFTTLDLRSSSLAEVWLGGLPPGLQAGDPVKGPLAIPNTPLQGPVKTLEDTVTGLLNLPLGQDPAPPSTGAPAGCLLSLLGLC